MQGVNTSVQTSICQKVDILSKAEENFSILFHIEVIKTEVSDCCSDTLARPILPNCWWEVKWVSWKNGKMYFFVWYTCRNSVVNLNRYDKKKCGLTNIWVNNSGSFFFFLIYLTYRLRTVCWKIFTSWWGDSG